MHLLGTAPSRVVVSYELDGLEELLCVHQAIEQVRIVLERTRVTDVIRVGSVDTSGPGGNYIVGVHG